MRPGQALKTSFFACFKNVLALVVFGMLMTMLIMASVIPLGLGLLITMPLYVISIYTAYRDIFYSA